MTDPNLIAIRSCSGDENLLEAREIQPVTIQEIQWRIEDAYYIAANLDLKRLPQVKRGAYQLLSTSGEDYDELPGFSGRTAIEIIKSLPHGSTVLDVGCGDGQLGADILGSTRTEPLNEESKPINAKIQFYGFDVQAQNGQDRLTGTVVGNMDDLSLNTFPEVQKGFDLVVSRSLYHLPDPWGEILRMSRVLKPNGVMLVSGMARVIYPYSYDVEAAEDNEGFLTKPDNGRAKYYMDRNVFDTNGRLIPPGEVIKILNENNQQSFELKYSVATAEMLGTITNGGQISGQRLSSEGNLGGLDLSCMFYCLSGDKLGYIMTQNPNEQYKLESQGYVNLQDRLQTPL